MMNPAKIIDSYIESNPIIDPLILKHLRRQIDASIYTRFSKITESFRPTKGIYVNQIIEQNLSNFQGGTK